MSVAQTVLVTILCINISMFILFPNTFHVRYSEGIGIWDANGICPKSDTETTTRMFSLSEPAN